MKNRTERIKTLRTKTRKRPDSTRIPRDLENEIMALAVKLLSSAKSRLIAGWRSRFKSELGRDMLKVAPGAVGLEKPEIKKFIVGITGLIDKSAKRITYTMGQTPADDWMIVNPGVYKAIETAAYDLAESTQKWIEDATKKKAGEVIESIRADMMAAQKSGQTLKSMTDTLSQYFDQSVRWKARQIARTESSRAYNAGYLIATADDEWVVGYEWLLSDDACDWCKQVGQVGDRGRRIKKGDNFAHNLQSKEVYKNIIAPPLHPNCFCTIVPILDDDEDAMQFDGPFGDTPTISIPERPPVVQAETPPGSTPTTKIVIPAVIQDRMRPVVAMPSTPVPPVKVEKPKKPRQPRKKKEPVVPAEDGFSFPDTLDTLEVVSSLGGTTGAQLVRDTVTGLRYVRKSGANAEHLRNEFYADELYRAFGVDVPESKLYDGQKPVKLSRYFDDLESYADINKRGGANGEAARNKIRENFAVDAILGNWDVMGQNNDNVMVNKEGKPLRIDNGGALAWRAMGNSTKNAISPNLWSDQPIDLWTLRDEKINKTPSPKVFEGVDWVDQVKRLPETVKMPESVPKDIRDLISKRIANAKIAAEEAETLSGDIYEKDYAHEHFARASMVLKNEKVFEKLPDLKELDYGHKYMSYEGRKQLRDAREEGPFKKFLDVAEKMDEWNVKDKEGRRLIESYMSSQAGSSWSQKTMGMKGFMEDVVLKKRQTVDFYRNKYTRVSLIANYKKQFKAQEKPLKTVFAYQHAYTYNLLRGLPIETKSEDNNRIALHRTSSISAQLAPHGKKVGDKQITTPQGTLESFGMNTVFGGGSLSQIQSVPIHRIFVSYLQGRSRIESQALLGDSESEAVVMGASDIPYDAYHQLTRLDGSVLKNKLIEAAKSFKGRRAVPEKV